LTHRLAVELNHRDESCEGPGDEGLVGRADFIGGEVPLVGRNTIGEAQIEDFAPCDPVEAVLARRSPDLAIPDDEEVGGVACGYVPSWIQHQPLFTALSGCVHTGSDAVVLGQAVDPGVLDILLTPPNIHGDQSYSFTGPLLVRNLVFGHYHQGR